MTLPPCCLLYREADDVIDGLRKDILVEMLRQPGSVRTDSEGWAMYQTFGGRLSQYTLRPCHELVHHPNGYVFERNRVAIRLIRCREFVQMPSQPHVRRGLHGITPAPRVAGVVPSPVCEAIPRALRGPHPS